MKPDDTGGSQRNVLGGLLGACSERPMTGFFRDGCCNTSDEDVGSHTTASTGADDDHVRLERLPLGQRRRINVFPAAGQASPYWIQHQKTPCGGPG